MLANGGWNLIRRLKGLNVITKMGAVKNILAGR
jgi:hypothetical protein